MSYSEYTKDFSIDRLEALIAFAKERVNILKKTDYKEYYVVNGNWINLGFFEADNPEGALAFFCEEFRKDVSQGSFEQMHIDLQKWQPSEVKDLIK